MAPIRVLVDEYGRPVESIVTGGLLGLLYKRNARCSDCRPNAIPGVEPSLAQEANGFVLPERPTVFGESVCYAPNE